MYKRFTIYIDIIATGSNYAKCLEVIEEHTKVFEPITRVLKALTLPECIYDCLIIDFHLLMDAKDDFHHILPHYEEIIVLNVPNDADMYQWLFESGITYYTRIDYTKAELYALMSNYMLTKRLRREKTILDGIMSSAQNSIVLTDYKGNIHFANPYFEKLTGYEEKDFILKSPNIIKSGRHDAPFYETLWKTLHQGHVWEGTFVNKSKNDHLFYEEATITPLYNVHGEIENFLKIGKNITREKHLLDELSEEVKLAKRVLEALLPKPARHDKIRLSFHLTNYNEVGGDFVYFDALDDNRFAFALIDVSGHGMSSTITAITIAQMFGDYMRFKDLSFSVEAINTFLCQINDTFDDRNKYMTGIFIEFDTLNHTMQVVNAGHLDFFIKTPQETALQVASNSMMIGVLAHQKYEAQHVSYTQGSKLIAFTDGLFEKTELQYDDVCKRILEYPFEDTSIDMLRRAFDSKNTISDDTTLCILTL